MKLNTRPSEEATEEIPKVWVDEARCRLSQPGASRVHPEKCPRSNSESFPYGGKSGGRGKRTKGEKKKEEEESSRHTEDHVESFLHVTRVCALPASARSRVRHATCQINE